MGHFDAARREMGVIAARQHGVVTLSQLRRLGFTKKQVGVMVQRGALRRSHRGVYFVGPLTARLAREMAAVLACGPSAAVSHRSAADLLKLLPYPAAPGPVHVTVPNGHRAGSKGIITHESNAVAHYEIREAHGIPVTSPNRTLIDLAVDCTDQELEMAVAEAFALRLTNRSVLLKAVKARRRPGVRRVRELLEGDDPKRTRSAPERRLLSLIRGAGLPEPRTNFRIGPWEVDFYWPAQGLVVEVDAYSTHSSPRAFERDRRKDAALADRGLTVQRATANQIRDEPELTVGRIRRNLDRSAN